MDVIAIANENENDGADEVDGVDARVDQRAGDGQRGAMVVMTDVDPLLETAFNEWYDSEHVPERVALPGVRGARRFVRSEAAPQPAPGTLGVQRGPKYMVIYDFDDLGVLSREWADLMQHHSDTSRAMYVVMDNTIRETYEQIGEFGYHEP